MNKTILGIALLLALISIASSQELKIDRRALVSRNNPHINRADPLTPLSVGNGRFSFSCDITGLQTFNQFYNSRNRGIDLATMAEWAWNSYPNPNEYRVEKFPVTYYEVEGRKIPYLDRGPAQFVNYLRNNPHKFSLGRISFQLLKSDQSAAATGDLSEITQDLDLWNGIITSRFTLEGRKTVVKTLCHPGRDLVAIQIDSELIKTGQLKIHIDFPFSSWDAAGANWNAPRLHQTKLIGQTDHSASFKRELTAIDYFVSLRWTSAHLKILEEHNFELTPDPRKGAFEFLSEFGKKIISTMPSSFGEVQMECQNHWNQFWKSGGAIDFSECTDPRAKELERRVVLSQYLLAIQEAGDLPPQETGLTLNSWSGKFHLEMHWWHGIHFILWDRPELFESSLKFYSNILEKARETAQSQGYQGARWPKCVAYEGQQMPCNIFPESFLIWQQPHPIYYGELLYQARQDVKILTKYKDLVLATADFMASIVQKDLANKRYILGPPVAPGQEVYDHKTTINPAFELGYWHFGLAVANQWLKRLHLPENPRWNEVLKELSSLPVKDGLYVGAETVPNYFQARRYTSDHPLQLGLLGMLPNYSHYVDPKVMHSTLEKILQSWHLESTWGWDYPLVAMAAARLDEPETAVNMLLIDVKKNTYLANGHNFQDYWLPLYLPGNGGLLTAVAMMTAGWQGYRGPGLPGFPKDGKWKVKWEKIHPIL